MGKEWNWGKFLDGEKRGLGRISSWRKKGSGGNFLMRKEAVWRKFLDEARRGLGAIS